MDQVRRMVDGGQLLNYDACVSNPRVWALAAERKKPGDDAGMSQTRGELCSSFYKNPTWRGGISAAIDDRKSVEANDWTPEKRKQYIDIRDDMKANFTNNMAVLKSQAAPAALEFPGAAKQIESARSMVESITGRMASETDRLNAYVGVLQSKQGQELVDEVSQTEFKLRNLEKENETYKKTAELRSEQATDLYKKYEGNYHSSSFGYMPLHPASRSSLLTVAFFFGFIALILLGIKLASNMTTMSSASTYAPTRNAIPRPTAPNYSRF